MTALAVLVFAALSEIAFAASPLAIAPRRHIGPDLDEARRPARLSLPSRNAALGAPSVHRMARVSHDDLQMMTPKSGVTAIGRHRRLEADALTAGRWDTLPNGTTVWRMAIHAPGALGIRLHFTGFAASKGRLWVHDGTNELSQIAGPYAGMGPYQDGDFWSDVLMSDTAVIEFQPGGTASWQGGPPFQIAEISHIFSDPQPSPKEDLSRAAAATCNLDSTCFSEWADTAKAVARISFESGGGSFVCSGTLLNTRNNSGDLLFLTANHCIDTDAVARTLQAFWFYQTNSCNGTPPSTRNVPRTAGSRLLVTGDRTQGDFALVRLDSVPSGVMFSGWDPAEVAQGTALTVVHHPSGDYKRIAFGNRVASSRITSAFYSVLYSQGLTEGGSSGSGLFSAPLMLTGTLSNGPKADTPEQYCRIIPFADNYGRFSSYYPLLRDILEGRSVTNPTTPPTSSRDLTSGVPAQVTLAPVSTPTLVNGASSYRIVVPQGATGLDVVLNTSTPNADVDLYVRFGADVQVTTAGVIADHKSEGDTGNERITITPGSNPVLRAGTYFISFGVFTPNTAINATLTATVTSSGPPPTGATVLTSGTSRPFTISAVSAAALVPGSFTIEVPSGATRLDIRLASTTPNVDLDLYARYNAEPVVTGGSVVADHRSEGATADEIISITSSSGPSLRAGTYFIRIAAFTTGITINATITATVTTGSTQPPTGVTVLTSGRAQTFAITPQTGPTLLNGASSYTIAVPQGATRLSIVLATTTPNVDVDLFARFGADTTVSGNSIVADHRSEGPAGSEQITITPASSPALRPGTYFITLAMFTTGAQATGTLTATVSTGATTPTTGPTVLTSGTRQPFNLPSTSSPTLHSGNSSFVIDVGANATRLDVQLTTTTPGADVDLFVRFGSESAVADGGVVADYSSEGPDGSERISITPESSPALRPGRYFISLAAFTANTQIAGSLLATVTTGTTSAPPPEAPTVLTSGTAAKFSLPAVDSATLYNGNYSYKVQVPEGATQLRIQLVSDNPAIDVDLYARFEADTDLLDGTAVADYQSESITGNESITITSASSPPLRPGTYFISLGLFSRGVASTGSITATVERGSVPPPTSSARELTSGVAAGYSLPSTSAPTLFNGEFSYRIAVGAEHTRLTISVRNDPADVDVDLFARFGQEPAAVANGPVLADFRSTGDIGTEDIVISGSNLRAGIYFISLALYTPGTAARGTITATLSSGGTDAEPSTVSEVVTGNPLERKPVVARLTPLAFKGAADKDLFLEEAPIKQTGFKKRQRIERVTR